jgi:integrase
MKTVQKLTTRLLETPTPPRTIVRDTQVRGLLVEYGKNRVSFKVQADLRRRSLDGKVKPPETIRMVIGLFPEMSVDKARAEAMRVLSEIKRGQDPRGQEPRGPSHEAPGQPRARMVVGLPGAWTVAEAQRQYITRLKKLRRAPRTIADHERLYLYLHGPADTPTALAESSRSELASRGRAKSRGLILPDMTKRDLGPQPLEVDDWRSIPIASITKEMARARHDHITNKHGPVIANKVMAMLGTWFKYASNSQTLEYPKNPIEAITMNGIKSNNRSLSPDELPDWYSRLQTIYSPLRRVMHEFNLLSGLRGNNVVGLEERWIKFESRAIIFPGEVMKNGEEFHLPLSEYMIELLKKAIALRNASWPNTPYVFPTFSEDGKVIPTVSWQERKGIPKQTGHFLRHSWSNMAKLAEVGDSDRQLLMAQSIPGVQGTYLFAPVLFRRLLGEQEKVTAFILTAMKPPSNPKSRRTTKASSTRKRGARAKNP